MIDLKDERFQILLVPPWENAGAEHWMSLWQRKHPLWRRVEQKDWMNPKLDEWIETLDEFVRAQTKPVVLVAHSLGSLTVAHWANRFQTEIAGAFLVAPPDVERADTPEEIKEFAPVPPAEFNFPSLLAASENDHYAGLERSKYFAEKWGSRFVNIGIAGHINTNSGHGKWEQGEGLLQTFVGQIFS